MPSLLTRQSQSNFKVVSLFSFQCSTFFNVFRYSQAALLVYHVCLSKSRSFLKFLKFFEFYILFNQFDCLCIVTQLRILVNSLFSKVIMSKIIFYFLLSKTALIVYHHRRHKSTLNSTFFSSINFNQFKLTSNPYFTLICFFYSSFLLIILIDN